MYQDHANTFCLIRFLQERKEERNKKERKKERKKESKTVWEIRSETLLYDANELVNSFHC